MTKPCIVCETNPADFDIYLCKSCADTSLIGEANARDAYQFMFRTGLAMLRHCKESEKKDEISPLVFETPAWNFTHGRKFHYFARLMRLIENVEGDIVECGVGAGRSLMYWLTLAYDSPKPRHLWGFDSFEGLPQPTEGDANRAHKAVIMAQDDIKTTLEKFINGLILYGIPLVWIGSHLTLVRGYFENTLPDFSKDAKIAILHIDANRYESYKVALDALYPKMSKGGVVLFDEYATTQDLYQFPGAKRAVDEFLESSGEKLRRDDHYGKYYIVKRGPLKDVLVEDFGLGGSFQYHTKKVV